MDADWSEERRRRLRGASADAEKARSALSEGDPARLLHLLYLYACLKMQKDSRMISVVNATCETGCVHDLVQDRSRQLLYTGHPHIDLVSPVLACLLSWRRLTRIVFRTMRLLPPPCTCLHTTCRGSARRLLSNLRPPRSGPYKVSVLWLKAVQVSCESTSAFDNLSRRFHDPAKLLQPTFQTISSVLFYADLGRAADHSVPVTIRSV